MIRCKCPKGHTLNVKDAYAGKLAKCPKCAAQFRIPAPVADIATDTVEDEIRRPASRKSRQPKTSNQDRSERPADSKKRRRAKPRPPETVANRDDGSDESIDVIPKKKRSFLSDLLSWKTLLLMLLLVLLAVIRTTINQRDPEAKRTVADRPATAAIVIERGEDFTIAGEVVVPRARGFTFTAEGEEKYPDGNTMRNYLSMSETGDPRIHFAIFSQQYTDKSSRLAFANSARTSMEGTVADGASKFTGPPPKAITANRYEVAFSCQEPTETLHYRFSILFGHQTYLYEAVSSSPRVAEQLFAFAPDVKEIVAQQAVKSPEVTRQPQRILFAPVRPIVTPPPRPKPVAVIPPISYDVVKLPGPAFDSVAGRGGEVLALNLFGKDEVAVVDLKTQKIVGQIPAIQETLIAAGQNHLVMINPADNRIERWSLNNFEMEASGKLDINGVPQAVAMGNASNGPLLLQWADTEKRYGSYGMMDLETFEIRVVAGGDNEAQVGHLAMNNRDKNNVELRASADGRVFGVRPGRGGTPERLFAGEKPIAHAKSGGGGGHAIPSADGRFMCTGTGLCGAGLTMIESSRNSACFPTNDSELYLALTNTGAEIRQYLTGNTVKKLPAFKELGRDFLSAARVGRKRAPYQFMPDQRIHCALSLNLIATIPRGEKQIYIRKVPIEKSPQPTSRTMANTLLLPGIIYDAKRAQHGQSAVLHLRERREAVVVDLVGRTVAGTIPVPDDALIAASQSHLLVVSAIEKTMTRWSLSTFQQEKVEAFEIAGIPRALVVGEASDGAAVLYWTNNHSGVFSEIDLTQLRIRQLSMTAGHPDEQTQTPVQTTGGAHGDVRIRAAADGRSFGLWKVGSSPHGVEIVTPGRPPHSRHVHDSFGYVIPLGLERVLTAKGAFLITAAVLVWDESLRSDAAFFPVSDPTKMLCLNTTTGQLRETGSGDIVATFATPKVLVEEMFRSAGFAHAYPYKLTLDQRVYCVPDKNVLATIPQTDDRLVFHNMQF